MMLTAGFGRMSTPLRLSVYCIAISLSLSRQTFINIQGPKLYFLHIKFSNIPCGDCEKVCLGQTKRQFCTRLKEHQRAVSNFNSSKLNQLWLNTCVKQAITLRGKILKSLPLTIVMFGSLAYQCEALCLIK